jgi:hypothetical protein
MSNVVTRSEERVLSCLTNLEHRVNENKSLILLIIDNMRSTGEKVLDGLAKLETQVTANVNEIQHIRTTLDDHGPALFEVQEDLRTTRDSLSRFVTKVHNVNTTIKEMAELIDRPDDMDISLVNSQVAAMQQNSPAQHSAHSRLAQADLSPGRDKFEKSTKQPPTQQLTPAQPKVSSTKAADVAGGTAEGSSNSDGVRNKRKRFRRRKQNLKDPRNGVATSSGTQEPSPMRKKIIEELAKIIDTGSGNVRSNKPTNQACKPDNRRKPFSKTYKANNGRKQDEKVMFPFLPAHTFPPPYYGPLPIYCPPQFSENYQRSPPTFHSYFPGNSIYRQNVSLNGPGNSCPPQNLPRSWGFQAQ